MDNYNETSQERPKVNPFLSIWLHPKQTTRYMIEEKSIGFAILLMSIGYLGVTLSDLIDSTFLSDWSPWFIVIFCVIAAPISGIIGTAFSALITWLFGKLFKGTGTYSDLFKGLSLTAIPFIVLIPFYLIWLFTSPESLMNSDYTGSYPWVFWLAILLTIVVVIWSIVITVGIVAEAHQIPNWMAFLTLLIPTIIFVILFIILMIVLFLIFGIFIGMM
ncbi:YIP1 family protein [Lysinibacillus xylanilyticus]|uniref:YIP1 family protein n=1 Tax=Lysinibacillus xylanilyticus TaxID=582475 RepID=UPI002B24FD45|nr:YIP1 family protein [Lysinibacillus xylanilyticus]MEB2299319.1 YIP1 family protein [Lysinibacillus xylanilyticus]